MVHAAVESTVVICVTCYTAMVRIRCASHIGVVGQIMQLSIICITHNTAGIVAAGDAASEYYVVHLCPVVGRRTQYISEQALILGCVVYRNIADNLIVAVEMTCKRCACRSTYGSMG